MLSDRNDGSAEFFNSLLEKKRRAIRIFY